jgi:ribosome maturation factor RimP
MNAEEKIKSYVEEAIADSNLFLVELRFLPKSRAVILLDGDEGIKIEECARISRHISTRMEEDNLPELIHTLEVSSPGVDFPLKFQRQYPQHIGRTLAIRMMDGKEIEGKLTAVHASEIEVDAVKKIKGKKPTVEACTIEIPAIKEAKIKIVF